MRCDERPSLKRRITRVHPAGTDIEVGPERHQAAWPRHRAHEAPQEKVPVPKEGPVFDKDGRKSRDRDTCPADESPTRRQAARTDGRSVMARDHCSRSLAQRIPPNPARRRCVRTKPRSSPLRSTGRRRPLRLRRRLRPARRSVAKRSSGTRAAGSSRGCRPTPPRRRSGPCRRTRP